MTTINNVDGYVENRLVPIITPDFAPYYEAAARGQLVLQRCNETGKFQYYPRPRSIYTLGEVEWVPAQGTGSIYTYSVVHNNMADPVFGKLVPYVVAMIELPEGVRMMGNICDCSEEDLYVGMPVEVYFRYVDEDQKVFIPFWRPAK